MQLGKAGRGTLVWLGFLVAVAAGGCAANPAPHQVTSGSSHIATPDITTPASAPAAASPPTPAVPSPTPSLKPREFRPTAACRPAALPKTAPYGSSAVTNLVISADERRELLAAYVACSGFPRSALAYRPGSTYYAYDSVTGRHWAMAYYQASRTAPFQVRVDLQETEGWGFFTKRGIGPWQVYIGGFPLSCAAEQFFPPSVLAVWSLSAWASGCRYVKMQTQPPS